MTSLVPQLVKNPPAIQENHFQSLGWEHPLKKGMATHSRILAWRIPWTEELVGHRDQEELDLTEQLLLSLLWHIDIILIIRINCILIHYGLFQMYSPVCVCVCVCVCVFTETSSFILPRSQGVVLRGTHWRSWSQTAQMWI